ncbi:phytanoyl-CoA dioxygenase family protein [Pseudomonas sp. MPFS]|uniref:phytanoyl-CoA dioxygenase family protein n=1 Tax=Pseudomonas sp. MPFS TaxID=2795724 RepID=UPI001F1329FD|nr:phytanoyl-CoA dioxygenase family protein [Pseudomonas sp. MPFS]UMZ14935.1 phytanoyl-CoA dioxygenase family protein [Pseudomonas sp. MPFS]
MNPQIEEFQRNGAIVLRGVFGDWIERLREGFEQNLAEPSAFAIENVGSGEGGRFFEDYCNWQRIPAFQDFVLNSPAAAIAGQLMESQQVQVFHDHILVKEPGTSKPTPWHQDLPYYCVDGLQTASYWIPLDPVTRSNTLSVVLGSHRWPKPVRPKSWASNQDFYGATDNDTGESLFMDMPDVDNGQYPILSPELQPGDAIVFDFRTVHGAAGNTGSGRRRAFSIRFMGDDVRYIQRPGRTSPPFPGIDLNDGDRMREDWFPVVWRRA